MYLENPIILIFAKDYNCEVRQYEDEKSIILDDQGKYDDAIQAIDKAIQL
jgi:hypothetical protein